MAKGGQKEEEEEDVDKKNNDDNDDLPKNDNEKSSLVLNDNLSLWDFLDPSNPWLLVPNGSCKGKLDWVPSKYYVEPHQANKENSV